MTTRPTHKEFKKRLLKNKAVKRAYDELKDEFNLKRALIRARIDAGKTQEDVAQIMHTTKSSISRMESIGGPSPSMRRVFQYADAVDGKFNFTLCSKKSHREK